MALQAKQIKSKIKSVGNIEKITKAMEKVAATKMRKSISTALSSREYAFSLNELVLNILSSKEVDHSFLKKRKGGKKLLVLISSNRGLCGAFNANVAKEAQKFIAENSDRSIDVIAVGKYSEKIAKKMNTKVIASFNHLSDSVDSQNIWPIAKLAMDEWKKAEYESISIIYTHYSSAFSFRPMKLRILPINRHDIVKIIDDLYKDRNRKGQINHRYTYEPDMQNVLDFVFPRVIEMRMFRTILESLASEHSSRMVAMKNASDNANKLIEDLNIGYNKARQDTITQEISEIVGGMSAMEEQ